MDRNLAARVYSFPRDCRREIDTRKGWTQTLPLEIPSGHHFLHSPTRCAATPPCLSAPALPPCPSAPPLPPVPERGAAAPSVPARRRRVEQAAAAPSVTPSARRRVELATAAPSIAARRRHFLRAPPRGAGHRFVPAPQRHSLRLYHAVAPPSDFGATRIYLPARSTDLAPHAILHWGFDLSMSELNTNDMCSMSWGTLKMGILDLHSGSSSIDSHGCKTYQCFSDATTRGPFGYSRISIWPHVTQQVDVPTSSRL